MFKSNNDMSKNEYVTNVNLVSRISEGTIVRGEIISSNDLRIDGKFEGSICSEGKVVIGESAEVNADITCVNVDVWGKAKGCFTVKDILSIKGGCSVDGDLKVRRLAIELDSSFNGTCKMITEQEYDAVYTAKSKKMQVPAGAAGAIGAAEKQSPAPAAAQPKEK